MATKPTLKSVETLKHEDAKRKNIPTAEHQSVLQKEQEAPRTVRYPRNTDYNKESFFVRHAYFLGANDPDSALKTTLKAEINAEAWASLNRDISRPFDTPQSGRIAVKVINHLGDEVMKVFPV